MIRRGEIWWASLPDAAGSGPGFRRPVLVVQANDFNDSAIRTVICAAITANLRLAKAPGNVQLGRRASGLNKESVVNVSQLVTLDKRFLTERVAGLAPASLRSVDAGLRLALDL